jgi:hypothetical protein
MIPYDDIALDGVTGVVYCLPGDEFQIYHMSAIDPEALGVSHSRWHNILEYVAYPKT